MMTDGLRKSLTGAAVGSWLCGIVWIAIVFPEAYWNIKWSLGVGLFSYLGRSGFMMNMSLAFLIVAYSEFKMAWVITRYPLALKRRFMERIWIASAFYISWLHVMDFGFMKQLLLVMLLLKIIIFLIVWLNKKHYQQIEQQCYQGLLAEKPLDEKIKKAQQTIVTINNLEKIWMVTKLMIVCYLWMKWLNQPWNRAYPRLSSVVFLSCLPLGVQIYRNKLSYDGLTSRYAVQHILAVVISIYLYYTLYWPWPVLLLYIIFRFYIWLIVRLNYQGLKYIDAMDYFGKQQEYI